MISHIISFRLFKQCTIFHSVALWYTHTVSVPRCGYPELYLFGWKLSTRMHVAQPVLDEEKIVPEDSLFPPPSPPSLSLSLSSCYFQITDMWNVFPKWLSDETLSVMHIFAICFFNTYFEGSYKKNTYEYPKSMFSAVRPLYSCSMVRNHFSVFLPFLHFMPMMHRRL